jgi:lipoprotein-anchoring transpeptidase ErfK/SrfK
MIRLGKITIALMALFLVQPISAASANNLIVPRPPSIVSPDQEWLQQARPDEDEFSKTRRNRDIPRKYLPRQVRYRDDHPPGTIVIDTNARVLYLVLENGKAQRYGVGVGQPGFAWTGTHTITRKAKWPDWRPPPEMIARERAKGIILPEHMEGGVKNPLGARALYLGDTLYRIHGSNQPWTIGQAVSSGCIRMRNEDVTDLYARVEVGTKVFVR